MISVRQDQRFGFNLGGHKIHICTDFKYIGVKRNRLTMLFYPSHYMVARYGALKIAKLLKYYIMISSDRFSTRIYMLPTPNTNQY